MQRPVVLVVADHFLPGFKAGGPIRSLASLIASLAGEFDFRVLTRNRDLGDPRPFPGIEPGRWLPGAGCRVCYLPPTRNLVGRIRRAARDVPYDLVYLNSFFSPFTVVVLGLRRARLLPRAPVVVTPRGELADGALRMKSTKKRLYLAVARLAGVYDGVVWQASSEIERADIARFFRGPSMLAANVPAIELPPAALRDTRPRKRAGAARFVFLGRLARNKNVEYALRLLARATGEIVFDIYGPAQDPRYFAELRGWMERLPPNVRCEYRGPVSPADVRPTLARYEFFLFPSFHESFGHGILEALLVGLPVLISDGTYWRGLGERGVGFDVPLADEARFLARLQQLVDLDEPAYAALSARAARFAADHVAGSTAADDYRRLFHAALARAVATGGA